uniref:Uncharacterized protein n=1 Tax=Panagrolaimus sp. PS1159 TaxID=55785 RepID=A0AC35EX93_9BILA
MKPKLQTSTASIFLKSNMKEFASLETEEENIVTFDEDVESENIDESDDSIIEAIKPRNKKAIGSRTKQRRFLSNKLKSLKAMSPKLYSEIMVGPALQNIKLFSYQTEKMLL